MNQPRDSKGRFVKRTARLRGGSAFYNPFENQMKGRGKGKIRGGDFFNNSGPRGPILNGTPLYTSGYSSNLDSLKKAFQGAYDNRDLIKYAAALVATGPAGVAYLASTDKGSQFLANQAGLGLRKGKKGKGITAFDTHLPPGGAVGVRVGPRGGRYQLVAVAGRKPAGQYKKYYRRR